MAYDLIQKYTSADVEDFRSLKGKSGHLEKGLFIAEGEKVVRKVLESSLDIPLAYMTEEHFELLKILFEQRVGRTNVYLATKREMEDIIGYHLHQGVMLACCIPENRLLLTAVQGWKSPWIAVALDGIADAENMGTIIRNAAAFGAKAVIVDNRSCNPYLRRSVRVSMGTIVDVEIIRVPDLAFALGEMGRIRRMCVLGATLDEKSIDLSSVVSAPNVVCVLGSEGQGLSEEVMDACDVLACIPMAPGVDSLNVAVASGVFLYALGDARLLKEKGT
jgi:tRNA G18 (ribose-2'-O)-methylase SpoU